MDETSVKETKTSLYRPNTKKGDPRLWVSGLNGFTDADDIHAISVYNKKLFVFNISKVDIEKCCNSPILTPIKEFVEDFYTTSTLVSDEYLELQKMGGKVEDVAVWTLKNLHNRLSEKHHETFWISVDNEFHDGKEFFRYRSIEHTRNPIIPQFDILLDAAIITIETAFPNTYLELPGIHPGSLICSIKGFVFISVS